MQTKPIKFFSRRWWLGQIIPAALVGATFYVTSGAYGERLDRDSRRIVVEIDPGLRVADPAGALSADDWRQVRCLASNAYFEARSEGVRGVQAVNDVVFNRMGSGLFPKDACAVVSQCDAVTGTCQFSWFHDGRDHTIRDKAAWAMVMNVSLNQWLYRARMADQTGGALRYHAQYVHPGWRGYRQTVQIGLHQFFRRGG